MPFDQEIGWNIFLIMFCINGMLGVGETLTNPPYTTHVNILKSPFDIIQNVTAITQPKVINFTNPSGTLLQNVTTNVINSTNGNPLNWVTNNFFYVLAILFILAQFISGSFIWSAMLTFHMPLPFVVLVAGGVYLLIIRSVFYYITGR
jgi:hypothetical protein